MTDFLKLWQQWMDASKAFEGSMAILEDQKARLGNMANPLGNEEFQALLERGTEINKNLLALSGELQQYMASFIPKVNK